MVKGVLTANPNAVVLALMPIQHSSTEYNTTSKNRHTLEEKLSLRPGSTISSFLPAALQSVVHVCHLNAMIQRVVNFNLVIYDLA